MFFQMRPGVERLPIAPLRRCVFEPCAAPWPVEVVLLHDALEAFAFRPADHIDEIARLKLRHAQVDRRLREASVSRRNSRIEFLRLDSGLLEFAEQRLGDARFLLRVEADLHRRITVVLLGQTAQQNVIAGRDHGHRTQPAFGVVNAGHADFLS